MTAKLTKPFKGMTVANISQTYHEGHKALDLCKPSSIASYGTPLCAPEDCTVLNISGDKYTPDSTKGLKNGYGIYLKGMETGYSYLFWHIMPIVPVNIGDTVKRGSIVAFMGNAGLVYVGNTYVPLEERTASPFKGTHLHLEMFDKGYQLFSAKKFVNPLDHIDFSLEPGYSNVDVMKATVFVFKKILSLTSK